MEYARFTSLMQYGFMKWSFFFSDSTWNRSESGSTKIFPCKFLSQDIFEEKPFLNLYFQISQPANWLFFIKKNVQLYRHFLSIFSAVQHERAPRTYSKKPSYFSDFSAIAAGAAAVAAASNHHQIAPGSIHSGARPPLLNPLGIPHGMHPYYPLHHFKSFFPALFPHATSGEFISMTSILTHTVAQPTKWRF